MSEWKWLESTKLLQEESFGVDFDILVGSDFADYVVMNHTALIAELGEFLNEVGWKPWAAPRGWVNRDEAIGELVDVGHFLANMLTALGVTDEEWEHRYTSKQHLNAARQAKGYDGRNKCPSCKRALDDVHQPLVAPNGDRYCICGYVLERTSVS